MVATGDAVAVGVGSSAFAGMPSRAAAAAAQIRAVERIRRVTLLSVVGSIAGPLEFTGSGSDQIPAQLTLD
jgi:hypothetical protein